MTDLYENISKEIQKNMETLYPILLPLAGSFLLSAVLLKIFIPVLRKVKLGQKIGCVGETALLESAIGCHVHFSVSRNDEPVDPGTFLD